MTRREFLSIAMAASVSAAPVIVPVHVVIDGDVKWRAGVLQRFWSSLWPEAVRDLARCNVRLDVSVKTGGVGRPPFREPIITGLDHGVINLVVTDRVPLEWGRGRVLSGVTTFYRGYHVCMVALNTAHGNQIPFVSVNSCLHELLHALMLDIFENRPASMRGEAREFRIDCYATRLWLLHGCPAVRNSSRAYLERLRSDSHSHV